MSKTQIPKPKKPSARMATGGFAIDEHLMGHWVLPSLCSLHGGAPLFCSRHDGRHSALTETLEASEALSVGVFLSVGLRSLPVLYESMTSALDISTAVDRPQATTMDKRIPDVQMGDLIEDDAYIDALVSFAVDYMTPKPKSVPVVQVLPPSVSPPRSPRNSDAEATDHSRGSSVTSSPPSADQKREKTRLKYRRVYHKRQARRQTLRDQVDSLEQELEHIASRKRRAAGPGGLSHAAREASAASELSALTRSDRERRLQDLSTLRMELKQENGEMRRRLREYEASTEHMWDELLAEHKLWVSASNSFMMLKQLTIPESLELRSGAIRTIDDVMASTAPLRSAGVVCGWNEKRCVDRGMLRFIFQKTFFRSRVADVANRMFSIVTDPRRIAKLYSPSMNTTFHFVQQVSEDCVVLLMEMNLPGLDAPIRTLPLISRRRLPNGVQIMIQPLIASGFPMCEDAEPGSIIIGSSDKQQGGLNDHCFGMVLEEAGGGSDCNVTFVGFAQVLASHTYYWLIEELLHCIRCEELLFGPRFSLPKA